jgi:uncharacterized protein (TIGR02231 family)
MFGAQSAAFAKPSAPGAVLGASGLMGGEFDGTSAPAVTVLTATATSGASSTTFQIPRVSTILSDNKPHKVTISVIHDLKPRFTYAIVPTLSQHAYLKATVTNTTKDFPFLAGSMNVFMDNNFVTTSDIKTVNPQEEFAMFLGADAGIRVDYKPVKKMNETSGFIVGKVNVQKVEHESEIKNTKSFEVAVVVYDQLPLSSDEKIKVKAVEPNFKDTPKGFDSVKLNKENNIEWRATIAAGGKLIIPFSYTYEWPKDKEVEISCE